MAKKKRKAASKRSSSRAAASQRTADHARLEYSTEAVEHDLLLRKNRSLHAATFGSDYLRKLESLAAEANRTRTRGGMRVLLLPGIMGSTLAVDGNTIWIDPFDIARGRLARLALRRGDGVRATGVLLPTYLELKLRLGIAGFRAEFFPYDWRASIREQGALLADRVRALRSARERVSIVAHSMGGLVLRAALKTLGRRAEESVEQGVLLGTPNFGSFVPAQVLNARYSTTDWVARLDLRHDRETLVESVYSTFLGLCQMLPEPSRADGADYFDTAAYPRRGPKLKAAVLRAARGVQDAMVEGRIGPDKALVMIAGAGIETVVGLERGEDEFRLLTSGEGDGTVPLRMARLPGAGHRYCQVAHGKLPTDNEVIRAVVDVLRDGDTDRLEPSPDELLLRPRRSPVSPPHREGPAAAAPPSRGTAGEDVELTDRELRYMLEPLAAPGDVEAAPVAPVATASTDLSRQPIVVGRKHQRRLDLRLARGDISQADGRAVLLGVFSDVRPGGASVAIDQRIDGVIAEVIERRMYSANLGEVFVLPTPRRGIRAEMVVLVGLGAFSEFNEQTLRFAVENAMRTMLRCQVDDLVTLPIGGNTGLEKDAIVRALLDGLLAALRDGDERPSLRCLTICENDAQSFERLTGDVLRLAASSRMDELELTVQRETLPAAPSPVPSRHALRFPGNRNYLIVRRVTEAGGATDRRSQRLDLSLLTAGSGATVLTAQQDVGADQLEALLESVRQAVDGSGGFDRLTRLGEEAGRLLLPLLIREALIETKPDLLTIVNDAWSSRVPWEILGIDGWRLAKDGNLNRRYATGNMSVAKWLRERQLDRKLRFLLVVDPTEDLPSAVREGERIEALAGRHSRMELTRLTRDEATRERITERLESGEVDVLHYAGHAFFDPDDRASSGIVCAGHSVLSARDLAGLDSLPSLAFFNACEAGRIRARSLPLARPSRAKPDMREMIDRNVSFAEAFLQGGIANYVGTYWPVGDDAAGMFAERFYGVLLDANPRSDGTIGTALRAARMKLFDDRQQDWANYIHYGEPAFQVKLTGEAEGGRTTLADAGPS